jgi:hypothetical protein
MRLDASPFPVNVNMINFEGKCVLVWMSQADTTKGKRVIVSNEPRWKMMTPKNLEPGVWKTNERR